MSTEIIGDLLDIREINKLSDLDRFLIRYKRDKIEIAIDLFDVNGDQYTSDSRGHDIIASDIEVIIKDLEEWSLALPPKEEIIDRVFSSLTGWWNGEEDLVEAWVEDERENLVKLIGLYGKEREFMEDTLENTLRDFFTYTSHVLTYFRRIHIDLWQHFKCNHCCIEDGKLFLTIQIYEEDLRDMGYEQPQKCKEVMYDIEQVFSDFDRSRKRKADRHRSRDR